MSPGEGLEGERPPNVINSLTAKDVFHMFVFFTKAKTAKDVFHWFLALYWGSRTFCVLISGLYLN